jgi:hypothetical protein
MRLPDIFLLGDTGAYRFNIIPLLRLDGAMDFELEREYSSKDMNWCGLLCCINPLGCISRKYISPSRHQSMYTQRERERERAAIIIEI